MVHAFGHGIISRSFTDRVVAHIAAEEVVMVKRKSSYTGQSKPREGDQAQPMRVHEAVTKKRSDTQRAPYASRKNQNRSMTKDEFPFLPKFKMSYKELLAMPGVADQLRFPPKSDRSLGPRKEIWCDFPKAFGHDVEHCIILGY